MLNSENKQQAEYRQFKLLAQHMFQFQFYY